MTFSFDDVIKDCTKEGTKIQTKQYLPFGKYPIIDQGQQYIAGYKNEPKGLFYKVPAIVFGDHTRIVKYVDQPFFLGADGVKVLCPVKNDINCKYLFYLLCGARIPDTGYNRHFKWIKELKFIIPTLEIQNLIVAVLDQITFIETLYNRKLQKLDELIKSRFIEMFGNEKKFETFSMHEISQFITVGIANSATQAYLDSGVVMLRNQNIKENFLDDNDLVYISHEFAKKYKLKKLKPNDILVTRTGYPGTACLVPAKYEGSQTFTTLIIRLETTLFNNPIYICHYINSSYGKQYVNKTKVGIAQQNFGAKVLAKMPILIPPLSLQNEFADFVEKVDKIKTAVRQCLEKLEILKKSLMQKYFG